MKIADLNLKAKKNRQRVGRGIAAGGGKTAGRGTKGQKARTGKKLRPNFEGGQTPFLQKAPKNKGFKSKRLRPQVVFTDQLAALAVKKINNAALFENGLILNPYRSVRIVQRGQLASKIEVEAQSATAGAIEALKAQGGSFTVVDLQKKGQVEKTAKSAADAKGGKGAKNSVSAKKDKPAA